MKSPDLYVSMSPFMHSGDSVRKIMADYLLALVPILFAGWFFFGWPAIKIVIICALTAVLTEAAWQKLMGRPIRVFDGTALVTGILLGLVFSSMIPWWMAVAGAFTAVVVGKHLLGGFGNSPFSPVVVGWTFIQVSYGARMADYPIPHPMFGMETGRFLSDPFLMALSEDMEMAYWVPWRDLLIGNVPSEIGTGCILAILLGGAYLLARNRITWHIPVAFIVSAWLFAMIFYQIDSSVYAHPTYHVLSGWMMLAALFLATEKGTAPLGVPGMLMYGVGCGVLTMIIRTWGVYMEGVPFAILLMNALTPLLDRVRPRAVGRRVEIA